MWNVCHGDSELRGEGATNDSQNCHSHLPNIWCCNDSIDYFGSASNIKCKFIKLNKPNFWNY